MGIQVLSSPLVALTLQYRKLQLCCKAQIKEVFVDIAPASRSKAGLESEQGSVHFEAARLSPEEVTGLMVIP